MSSSSRLPRVPANQRRLGALLAPLFAFACVPSTATVPGRDGVAATADAAVVAPFDAARLERPQSPIHVDSHRFLNEAGAAVIHDMALR